ncbi:hypothetical protein CYMTET_10156, partial [Cymbomonas tetramitiformis]
MTLQNQIVKQQTSSQKTIDYGSVEEKFRRFSLAYRRLGTEVGRACKNIGRELADLKFERDRVENHAKIPPNYDATPSPSFRFPTHIKGIRDTLEGGGIPLPDKPPYRNLETAAGIYTGLAELPFLKRMVDHGVPKPFIYILLQHCYVKKVPKGQVLAEAGEHPDNMYLVLEGFLAVHPPRTGKEGSSRPVVKAPEREVTEKKLNWRKSMKKVAEENAKKAGKTTFSPRSLTELTAKARDLQPITLGPGNCWGERAFMFGDDYSNSAYANATGDCDVLVFPFEEYQATLCRIGIATGLQNTPQLARIMGSQHVSIAQACQIEVYDEGDTLFKQGDKGDCCYIITGGAVRVSMRDAYSIADMVKSTAGN